MRRLAVALLLFASMLMAETQQAAYLRAMQAEEAGDISGAIRAFEEAVLLPGPYTEELQEIIQNYKLALGQDVADTLWNGGDESPLSYRFLGNLGFYGLHYEENGLGDDASENGGDLFLSQAFYLDYSVGNWIHSFGISGTGDWFIANSHMPALDTCDWKVTLGLEYILVGPTILLSAGIDLNTAEDEDFSPAFYGWLEKDFVKMERSRIGVSTGAYYDTDGPLSFALYGAWRRSEVFGWNGSIYLGLRFDADSVMNYKRYLEFLETADGEDENIFWGASPFDGSFDPMGQCIAEHGSECFSWPNEKIDSLYGGRVDGYQEDGDDGVEYVVTPMYYGKWLGPAIRSKLAYKFRTKITVEGLLNLFYGFVLDGPDSDYEKMRKFSGTWGMTASWKPGYGSIYVGMEQLYRHYFLPSFYKGVYAESNFLTELKIGVKWEI